MTVNNFYYTLLPEYVREKDPDEILKVLLDTIQFMYYHIKKHAEGLPALLDTRSVDKFFITEGYAVLGTSTTIQLASTEEQVDDLYNNYWIRIVGGTSAGDVRQITDYDGSTRTATVSEAFTSTPDTTTYYGIMSSHPGLARLGDMVGIRPDPTDSDLYQRKQIENAVVWYKQKGLLSAINTVLRSYGFTASIYELYSNNTHESDVTHTQYREPGAGRIPDSDIDIYLKPTFTNYSKITAAELTRMADKLDELRPIHVKFNLKGFFDKQQESISVSDAVYAYPYSESLQELVTVYENIYPFISGTSPPTPPGPQPQSMWDGQDRWDD